MGILKACGLRKIYGSGETAVHALDGVDLTVEKGEFVAIVGTSGSGKSTLIQHFNALIQPTSGQILIMEKTCGRRIITAGLFEVRWGWYSSIRSTSCLRIQFWQMFALAL